MRFAITITIVSAIHGGKHCYKINSDEYSFIAGHLTYVTLPTEKEVEIETTEETSTYVKVSPVIHDQDGNDCCYDCHVIMATIDDKPTPTIIFNGVSINSNVEFIMNKKATIKFINKDEYCKLFAGKSDENDNNKIK